MTHNSLTLLLSGVTRHVPEHEELPTAPALQLLLSKASRDSLSPDLSACLFDAFSLAVDVEQDLPVGAISALGEGLEASSGWWLRADPVHMVADRDQLYLSAADALAIEQEEADALVTELNSLYAEDGWQFTAATPRRWYLRLPQPLAMRTIPTTVAMGSRVGEVLPHGDDALVWHRVMTEIQMLLHASPVNMQRREKGLLELNSLWFWGGGALPEVTGRSDWNRVVADDPLARGLARLHGVVTNTPESTSVAAVVADHRVLWQAGIQSIEHAERELFAPLLQMLRTGTLFELVIDMPGIARWHIDRSALRRWWRRRKPLAELLRGDV